MRAALARSLRFGAGCALVATAMVAAGWALGASRRDIPAAVLPDAGRAHIIAAPSGSASPEPGANAGVPGRALEPVRFEAILADEATCETLEGESGDAGTADLELALVQGTETERYDALMAALESGLEFPTQLLGQIYASDVSENVRLLALTTYVDAVPDDRAAVRAALQSALLDSASVIRHEAQRRLEELDRYESMATDAATLFARQHGG